MGPQPTQPQLHQRLTPRPVTRLNRKVILAVFAVIALILALSLRQGSPPSLPADSLADDEVIHTRYRQKPSGMLALPDNYADMQQFAKLEPRQKPVVAQQPMVPTQTQVHNTRMVAAAPNRARESAAAAYKAARESALLFQLRNRQQVTEANGTGTPGSYPENVLLNTQGEQSQERRRRFDQNRQDDKRKFLERASERQHEILSSRIQEPLSPYTVQAGSIIPAVLQVGINSDLPGFITGVVRETVYDSVTGTYLLIPQGTKLVGVYDSNIVFGQRRILVAWQQLKFPNGSSLSLEGMPGVDLAGFAGLKDKINHHYASLFASVMLSTLLSVGARIPAGSIDRDNITPADEFAERAAQNFNQAGQRIIERNLNRQPTLDIRPGMSFNVMVHRDMILRPYQESRSTR